MGEELSHDEVFPVLNDVLERLEEAVESEGGEVPGNWGDAIIALFGSRRRGENHARAAIRAALKMQMVLDHWNAHVRPSKIRELKVRFGLHTNEAALGFLGGKRRKVWTAIGRMVNIGARLEPLAFFETHEGEKEFGILASKETLLSAGPRRFVHEPAGSKKLKGIAEEVETYRIHHQAPPSLVPRGTDQTSFIGRHEDLSRVREAFVKSRTENKSKLVVVKAEGGEGKSRFGDRFIKNLGQEATILIAQGEDREALFPYEAIATAIRAFADIEPGDDAERARDKVRYVTQSATAGDQDADRDIDQRLPFLWKLLNIADPNDGKLREMMERGSEFWEQAIQTVETLFSHLVRDKSLVMVLEDLHWMDPGSVNIVERLIKKLGNRPFFVLGLSRPPFVEAKPTLLQGDHVEVVSLEPLTDEQLRKMVEEILPSIASEDEKAGRETLTLQLIALSGRNPYLISETASAVKAGMAIEQDAVAKTWRFSSARHGLSKVVPLPSGALGFLQAKIDLLEPYHREVLRLAAVIGAELSVDDLAGLAREVLGTTHDDQLLSEEGGRRLISDPKAFLDELVAAKVLIPVEDEPGKYRFPHALLRETAYEQTWKGNREAIHRALARHLQSKDKPELKASIASHLGQGGERARASQFYYEAAQDLFESDKPGAKYLFKKAVEMAETAGDKFRALKGWNEALITSGIHPHEFDEVFRLSLDLLDRLPPLDRAGTYYRRGRAMNRKFYRHGQAMGDALGVLEQSLSMVHQYLEGVGHDDADALRLKGSILFEMSINLVNIGLHERARDKILPQALEIARSSNDPLLTGRVLMATSFGAYKSSRYAIALRTAREAEQVFTKIGRQEGRLLQSLIYQGMILMNLGFYTEAERIFREVESITEKSGRQGDAPGVYPKLFSP